MKLLFILIFILLNTPNLFSQLQGQEIIDSLLKELPKMKEDTNAVNLLSTLSWELYSINPDKGIEYGLQGVKLAKELNWKKGEADCNKSIGNNYKVKSDYPKALEYFKKSIIIKEELGVTFAGIIHNIGAIYYEQSDYPRALEYFQRAITINEKPSGNKQWLANNLVGIGAIYFSQLNYPKALEYFNRSLKLNKTLGDTIAISSSLSNIGTIHQYQFNYPKALEYYNRSLKLVEKIGHKSGIADALYYIGLNFKYQADYPKSLLHYHKSLKIYQELGSKSAIAFCLGDIGALYLSLSKDSVYISPREINEFVSLSKEINISKAIELILESIRLFEEIGELHERSNNLKILADAYKQKGDYKNALEYYKISKELNDSVFSSENQTTIAKLEAKRENELKEKEIVILKKEKENQKLQRYAMFGGIAGLGIIIGLILIQRRKSEKLLLNVLPAKIANRLKAKEHPIADHFEGASIMFVDIVGFTSLSSDADPKRIVSVLNDIFTIFDKLADKHGLEKIKTIGDAYMAVAGIPEIQKDHSKRAANMALDIKAEMKDFKTSDGTELKFRIGIDCGAVVAGVIGEKKFIYDLWSDAVNTASRMESTGESGQIQITDNFKSELEKFEGNWNFTLRGEFEIKGKGLMKTYFLEN